VTGIRPRHIMRNRAAHLIHPDIPHAGFVVRLKSAREVIGNIDAASRSRVNPWKKVGASGLVYLEWQYPVRGVVRRRDDVHVGGTSGFETAGALLARQQKSPRIVVVPHRKADMNLTTPVLTDGREDFSGVIPDVGRRIVSAVPG